MLKRSYFRKITNSSNILDILMDKFKNNTNFYSIRKNDNQIETTYKEYDYSGIALSIKLTVYDQGIRVNISVDETIRILFIATIIIHPVLYIANVYLNFK